MSAKRSLLPFLAVFCIAINIQSCNLGTYPTSAADWDKQACYKYSTTEYNGASMDWDRAILLEPENAVYWWKRSRATMRVGGREQQGVDDAIKAIELLKDKDPRKLIYFYVQLGEAYAKKAEFKNAKDAFDKAVELSKGKVDAAPVFMERGRVLLMSGNLDGAIADLTTAISTVPTLGRAYFYRGKAYEAKKDPINAGKDFDKAGIMNYEPIDDRWEPLPIEG